MVKHYPSLQAFKAAKAGEKLAVAQAKDPLEHLHEQFGYWFTGGIADLDKPLPEIVPISSKVDAKKLASKGGRPIHLGEPELIKMTLEFYEGENRPEMPEAIKALAASVKAAPALPAAPSSPPDAKAEKGKK